MNKIEKMLEWAINTAEDNSHGYSQVNREGNPDYDCSSFVSEALRQGGFKVNGYPTTRELYYVLASNKWIDVKGADRKKGDILLIPGKHVAICADPNHLVHARSDENKGIQGKKPGDQTEHEIEISDYYVYQGGWTYHMRYMPVEYTDDQYERAALFIASRLWELYDAVGIGFDKIRLIDELNALDESESVVKGYYGNMPERKEMLESRGYDYKLTQKYTNYRMGALE
ncbi:MAG: NlpC/P60 family protein [Lachnospiraceae bacterium]|nr:NlpC/P60 family protein [Lachnospiraceae bacterium]